jgi:predicted acyltransferase
MEKNNKIPVKRLYSLDALRGFDMFWIMGGAGIFTGLAALVNWAPLNWWAGQLEHVQWHGFKFYDIIFPLFLYIAGISFPYSLSKRTELHESRKTIYRHIIFRGLILVFLGIIYNNAVRFNFDELRYGSVLGRIGLAWMFATIIYMNTNLTFRLVWFWSILIGYWLLLLFFPAHDLGSTDPFSQTGNLASYIDRLIMPGKLYLGNHDPEGIFSTIPAVATALLGMFTGDFMRSKYLSGNQVRKAIFMILVAALLMVLGKIWDLFFPINKNIWSSSFVCFAGGLSLMLFTIFYLIIDVWNFKKWAFFFVIIGLNPITIYLANRIINFRHASDFLFGGFTRILPESWGGLIGGIGLTTVGWLFLYFLYKRKIFLKV